MKKISWLLCVSILVFSCQDDEFTEQDYINLTYEIDEENLVSDFSITGFTADKAFGTNIPNLTDLETAFFGVGNAMFNQTWVSAPASTTSRDGLGPIFNARACATCHLNDGRGEPILETGAASSGFLLRLSSGNNPITGPIPHATYGDQLQDASNLNIEAEGDIAVNFEYISGAYPDGTTYELRKPTYTVINTNYGALSAEQSPRIGQQLIGLGFIEALSDASILEYEDEFDTDGDGISGKANYVWNIAENKTTLGKFGWKANQPTLTQQVSGAFNGDMGLTTTLFPEENCPSGVDCSTIPNGNNEGEDVEVPDTQLSRMMVYMSSISVPVRRDYDTYDVLKGKELFKNLACVNCHVDYYVTGQSEIVPIIDNVTIRPYSDFLLHDMGDDLADDRADFLATGNEWRTQPLWGLGMIELVNDHTFLLHDGRARNIEEAILWHGGEAETSKNNFMNLTATEREQLLSFLNSL
ncbi:di-heme oxidoreductase family protein [Neotamlana laminarinivorans]|uniref:Thiol oxidoreductase n=1 Tax=Neotamlana laminarinivorans TaxID=2883124 RepID=A0A9X1I189_9FLAO|nr:di-heme oxidoredictase family protein [Tamlana laminarinivorans]MCB4799954.1 thiol oxidoreductase [Tamlana laminarinivorans]